MFAAGLAALVAVKTAIVGNTILAGSLVGLKSGSEYLLNKKEIEKLKKAAGNGRCGGNGIPCTCKRLVPAFFADRWNFTPIEKGAGAFLGEARVASAFEKVKEWMMVEDKEGTKRCNQEGMEMDAYCDGDSTFFLNYKHVERVRCRPNECAPQPATRDLRDFTKANTNLKKYIVKEYSNIAGIKKEDGSLKFEHENDKKLHDQLIKMGGEGCAKYGNLKVKLLSHFIHGGTGRGDLLEGRNGSESDSKKTKTWQIKKIFSDEFNQANTEALTTLAINSGIFDNFAALLIAQRRQSLNRSSKNDSDDTTARAKHQVEDNNIFDTFEGLKDIIVWKTDKGPPLIEHLVSGNFKALPKDFFHAAGVLFLKSVTSEPEKASKEDIEFCKQERATCGVEGKCHWEPMENMTFLHTMENVFEAIHDVTTIEKDVHTGNLFGALYDTAVVAKKDGLVDVVFPSAAHVLGLDRQALEANI